MQQDERNLTLARLQVRRQEPLRFDLVVGDSGKNWYIIHYGETLLLSFHCACGSAILNRQSYHY